MKGGLQPPLVSPQDSKHHQFIANMHLTVDCVLRNLQQYRYDVRLWGESYAQTYEAWCVDFI